MLSDWLQGLGIIALFVVLIVIICIPFIAGIIVAMAIATWLNVSGILWWSIVIVVAFILWGIMSLFSK